MTVKLGARIEADVSPLVEALATAGQALDQFEGRVQAANDELTQIGDAGSASLGSLVGGAGQAADALAPLGTAAEAVRAVAAAAQDGDAALGTFSETGGAAAAALTSLFEIANDNRGFAGITSATGEAADGLERLGGTGSAALAMLVQPAADAETAVAGLAPVVDGAGQALADLLGAAGNTEGLNQLAQATAGVGEAFSSLTAGDEGFARDLAANQQQLSALATARTEIAQTYTLTVNKPTAADNFASVTQIATGTVSVANATNADLSLSVANLGDCSNGLEIIISAACGAISSKNLYLGDLQLVAGSLALPMAPRPMATETTLVARYLRPCAGLIGKANSASNMQIVLSHPDMRVAPSYEATAAVAFTDAVAADFVQSQASVTTVHDATAHNGRISCGFFSGLTSGTVMIQKGAGGTILASAEL